MKPSPVGKYLQRYAEPELQTLPELGAVPKREFALVIPAYDERPAFLESLLAHPKAGQTLLILVLNAPDDRPRSELNSAMAEWIRERGVALAEASAMGLFRIDTLLVLLVDRFSEGREIPAKQGVGLARKIGADLALALIERDTIAQPWIFSSDADARLPNNYFSCINNAASASALSLSFRHDGEDPEVLRATRTYESMLEYYRQGLETAGSPYAFTALGSCLVLNAAAYAAVRGFPKRSGGEDFYLLNKLAKIAPVRNCDRNVVTIEARLSTRVPFGTGPAVQKILLAQRQNRRPLYYDPRVFAELPKVVALAPDIWTRGWDEASTQLSASAQKALLAEGLANFVKQRRQQDKSQHEFVRHYRHWFDAFKTLKFLHRLQEYDHPPQSYEQV